MHSTAEQEISPIDIELEGIGHVLRDRRLSVPPYQRRYSWEQEEVSDFWWDLRASFGTLNPEYFLGSIVLTRDSKSGNSEIIDGQQRLTTASLLLLSIRNEFLRRGDSNRAQVIEREYGMTVDLRTGASVTRLVLNEDDQPIYEALFASRSVTGTTAYRSSERLPRIQRALAFLEENIQQEARNAGPHWVETLLRWVDFLERRVRVINVSVATASDAFLIFETLNARGRALTVADLLKNYLFGLAGSDLALIQQNWLSALRALETSASEEVFTTYVRHLWSSMHGATRERDLYSRMKATITGKPAALSFGGELERSAPLYSALLNTDQPFWSDHGELLPMAETLFRLGLEQNRPLLLAAMRRFSREELAVLIEAAISWSVRGLIVGGIGGGTTERAYGEAAVAVSEGRARDTASIFEELATVIPTDEVFRQAFATRRISRTTIAKYLLVALGQLETGRSKPLVVSEATEAQYQLSSILPRNADPRSWHRFAPDEIAEYSSRIGNLYVTEIQSGVRLPLASIPLWNLPTPDDWTPELVAARQVGFAGLAVSLWPRHP